MLPNKTWGQPPQDEAGILTYLRRLYVSLSEYSTALSLSSAEAGTSHATLSDLPYSAAGHTGFEPTITAGTSAQYLKGDKSLGNQSQFEPALGNPATSGYILSSTNAGVRSWVSAGATAAHVLDSASHTVSGETPGYFLKALSATTFGFAAHGLTYSDVGADAAGAAAAVTPTTLGLVIGTNVQAYNSNLTGINQALDTTASPAFVTAKLSALTDGYVPYHVNDATGLANTSLFSDGNNIGMGQDTFGSGATRTLALHVGVGPGDSPANAFQMYAAPVSAGNAIPYFRTENGTVIGLNQSMLTTDSPTLAGLTIGTLAGLLKGTAGVVSAITNTTAADYMGGDGAYHTLNQAAVAGLTTASTPRFAGIGIGTDPAVLANIYSFYPSPSTAGSCYGILSYAPRRAVDVNETNYFVNGYFNDTKLDIATGITDAGYRMGFYSVSYASDVNFEGTLANQYGIRSEYGIVSGTGTITNSYGLYLSGYVLAGTITNRWGIYQIGPSFTNYLEGNLGLGQKAFGTSATNTLGIKTGTAPSTSPADAFQMYSADQAAGNACAHFRTEGGAVVKLYRQAHQADLNAAYAAGNLDTEAEIITALNATNAKINALILAFENNGLLASA